MNNCKWGNLDDPRVYVDPESFNNAMRPKMDFLFVGQMLLDQGKRKNANNLLICTCKNSPILKFVFDMYDLPFIDMYYKTGTQQKSSKNCRKDLLKSWAEH